MPTYFCGVLLLIDNYDSFTYNLYDYFKQAGAEIEVIRNDSVDISSIGARYQGIILSPGPGEPLRAGCTMKVIEQYHKTIPILGVCLGMQAIGMYFGARLARASFPMHGKVSTLSYDSNHLLFKSVSNPFDVCRYHSLILENIENTDLQVIASTEKKEIMAIQHKSFPCCGVQFHPEAILSTQGLQIIKNWYSSLNLHHNNTL